MNETMTVDHSEQLGDLAKALAKAQGELQDAKKDAKNPHFKNTYATLASVRAAVTPVLAKCGLCTLQSFEPHGADGVCVVTWLLHESGQFIRSRLYLPVSKKDAQGFGSAISYGRRYALAAIAGIAADDDDDAEVAIKPQASTPQNATAMEKQLADSIDFLEWKKLAIARLRSAVSVGELSESWLTTAEEAKKKQIPPSFMKDVSAAKDEMKAKLMAPKNGAPTAA